MKKKYIEQMNVADRNNSLRGYYDNLSKFYKHYIEERKEGSDIAGIDADAYDKALSLFDKSRLSFAMAMRKFKKVPDVSGKMCSAEEFDAFRFQLSKNLNLIESLLHKLCHDSIDSSIDSDSTIDEINQAITWQFVDCINVEKPTYQDLERIRQIIKANDVSCTINLEKNVPKRTILLKKYKESLREVLKDMFTVLGNLVNFDQYLTVVEEQSAYSFATSVDDLKYLKSEMQINQILTLTETVKALILDYLVGYVKIRQLNLPHSFLKEGKFTHSILSDGNFMSSELSSAIFRCSTMRNCDLSMCSFNNIDAVGADFTGSTLNYSDLSGTDFSDTILNDCAINSVTLYDKRITNSGTYEKLTIDRRSSDGDKVKVKIDDLSSDYTIECDNNVVDSFQRFQYVSIERGDIVNDIINAISRNSENELKNLTMNIRPQSGRYADVLISFSDRIRRCLERYQKEYAEYFPDPVFMNWAENAYKNSRFNYSPAILRNASVKRSALPNSDIPYIDINGASFDDSDLSNSKFFFNNGVASRFSNANVSNCKFNKCDFSNSSFFNANAMGSEFIDCDLSASSFAEALIIGAKFINTERKENYVAELIGEKDEVFDIEMPKTETAKNIWKESVVAHADMRDCNLQHCVFSNGVIVGMDMDRSTFSRADMKKSFFENCLIRWSDMYRVNLSYSLLIGNVFDHTTFNESNFSNSRTFASVFSECNISQANMISCRFDNAIFINCDFSNVNMANTVFIYCKFYGCNFGQANMSKTIYENCIFDSCKITESLNFKFSKHVESWIVDDGERERLFDEYGDIVTESHTDGRIINVN